MASREHEATRPLAEAFPRNPYVRRLVDFALARGIRFEESPLPEQWMYHPGRRAILLWPPDLSQQTLSYLVLILAHELGHACDFDRHPRLMEHLQRTGDLRLHRAVERSAFVRGFILLKRLQIPVSLSQYVAGILPPMDEEVRRALGRRLCCLMDARASQASRPPSGMVQPPPGPAGLPPVA